MKKIGLLLAFVSVIGAAVAQHAPFREYGFYGTASYTMLTNVNRSTYTFLLNGVNVTGGFQIRPKTCVELGVGFLGDSKGVFSQVPLTLGLRTHYLDSWITPTTELYAGYSFFLKKRGDNSNGDKMQINSGGVTAGVNVGARMTVSRKLAVNVYVGWQFFMVNEFEVFDQQKNTLLKDSWAPHCFRFGLGLMF